MANIKNTISIDINAMLKTAGFENFNKEAFKAQEQIGEFNKAFKDLDNIELDRDKINFLRRDYELFLSQLQGGFKTGTFSIKDSDIQKLERDFSRVVDMVFNKMQQESGKLKIFEGLNKEIEDLNKSFVQSTSEIDKISGAIDVLKKNLKEASAKGKGIPTNIMGTKKEDVDRRNLAIKDIDDKLAKTDLKDSQIEELEERKKRYQEYGDLVLKISEEINELNEKRKKQQKNQEEITEKIKNKNQEKAKIVKEESETMKKLVQMLEQISSILDIANQQKAAKLRGEINAQTNESTKALKNLEEAQDGANKSLGKKITTGLSYYVVFNQIRRLYRSMIRTITDLDKALTTVAMVTTMNRKEATALVGAYQQLARETGVATAEIANLSVYFFRQGRNVADALELTKIAAQSARVAGISALEAANYLTSAVNGFGLAAKQASEVADKFAKLAASSASSFEELAIAMSKVAPVAQSAGISIDFMMGVLAKGIETTREAPENIGTAFKTVFARMREITDIGKAVEDGMSLNRVERALDSIGVALRDSMGQFRNLEDVLMDVGNQWHTLTSLEQAYLATALAGTRQQPRLLAIFNDFERTKELIEISRDSTMAMSMQHMEYMKGMEAAMIAVQNAWQELVMAFTDSEFIIGIVRGLANAISSLASFVDNLGPGFQKLLYWTIALTVGTMALVKAKLLLTKVDSNGNKVSAIGIALDKVKTAIIWILTKSIKINTKGLLDNTAGKKLNFAATLKLNWANLLAAKGFIATAKAAAALLIPFLKIIVIIGLVVGAFFLIKRVIMGNDKSIKKHTENIKKAEQAMYELGEKRRNIEKLRHEFDELNKSAIKTREQIDRTKELLDEFRAIDPDLVITVGGVEMLDEAAYNRYLEANEEASRQAASESRDELKEAFSKEGVDIFTGEDAELYLRTARNMGIRFAEAITKSIEDENIADQVNKAIGISISKIDPSNFTKMDWVPGPTSGSGGVLPVYREIFDEEGFKKVIQFQTAEYIKFYKRLDEANEDNSLSEEERIEARIKAYNIAVDKINKYADENELSDEIRIELLANLSYVARDEAILKMLVEDKNIPVDVILQFQRKGFSMTDISDILGDISTSGLTNTWMMSPDQIIPYIETLRENAMAALGSLVGSTSENLGINFERAKEALADMEKTPEEIDEILTLILDRMIIGTDQIVSNINEIRSSATKLADLPSKIAQGDFSTLAELSETFGPKLIEDFLSGDISINDLLEEQIKNQKETIKQQIGYLNQKEDLNEAEERQLQTLELILANYDYLTAADATRVFHLEKVKNLTDRINSNLKMQQSLLDFGISEDSDLFQFFSQMQDLLQQDLQLNIQTSFEEFGNQYEDIARQMKAAGLMDAEGGLIPVSDMTASQRQIFESYKALMLDYENLTSDVLSHLNQEYEKQAKIINERYDSEINAIREAHSERWSELDYANKLLDLQDQIFASRQRLLGASLEGTSRSAVNAARRDLLRLQQERQRAIEEEAMKAAEKEMEARRQKALEDAMKDQVIAMEGLTMGLDTLNNTLTRVLNTRGGSGSKAQGTRIEDLAFAIPN